MSPESFHWPIAELLLSRPLSLYCFQLPTTALLNRAFSYPQQCKPQYPCHNEDIKRVPSTHFHESCGNLVSLKETISPAQMPNQLERPTESLQDHTSLG